VVTSSSTLYHERSSECCTRLARLKVIPCTKPALPRHVPPITVETSPFRSLTAMDEVADYNHSGCNAPDGDCFAMPRTAFMGVDSHPV